MTEMGKNIWRAHKETDKLILVGKLMKKKAKTIIPIYIML